MGTTDPRPRPSRGPRGDRGSARARIDLRCAPTERETEIAELVAAVVPSIEKVRFVSSGTEAAMSAVRLARGATGRDKIIKMTGHYHGHVDALLVQAGSSATTLGTPNSPGVTVGAAQDTILCAYNDANAVATAFNQYPGRIAAVLLEPVPGNMGLVPPHEGYLERLRELCSAAGALLVFDEVMTGFRLALGGAQERYGVTPDLTILGKVIGGGLPAAAYGGPAALMNHVSPSGPVFQAGTLSGNPLAMAAGLTTLRAPPPRRRTLCQAGGHLGPTRGGAVPACPGREDSSRGPARRKHAHPVLQPRTDPRLR